MKRKRLICIASALSVSACATMDRPTNATGSLYAAQQSNRAGGAQAPICKLAPLPTAIEGLRYVAPELLARNAGLLSSGDRLRLTVSGDKDQLTGTYVIAADGMIQLLNSARIEAAGKSINDLEKDLEQRLIQLRLVRGLSNGVRLSPVELNGVSVAVSGAVFETGIVRVGERQPEVRSLNISNIVSGDMNASRTLMTALRAAGGVRPDADLRSVYLLRNQNWTQIDLTGALGGSLSNDLPVNSGDRIIVQSTGCLQEYLVRPSLVTTPGIRVFLSNLSRPAASNASSAIGKDSTSLPYGTRFLQGLVAANCVGGSAMNAGRSAVLISRNPVTGQSVVISRSVERLVRSADRDAFDPYLMPGDSIACYDGAAMNLRDVVSTVSEMVTPYVLFRNAK
jgi:polysaccharide biosynthesis/export protein